VAAALKFNADRLFEARTPGAAWGLPPRTGGTASVEPATQLEASMVRYPAGMRGDERGVTLVELLTVITIIGIITAIALPRIDLTRMRVDAAMQSLGTTMLASQRLAVSRGHDIVVMFDAANSSIRIHEDVDGDATINGTERVRAVSLGDQVIYGTGGAAAHPVGAGPITFAGTREGLSAVVFHRSGSASEFGGVYLTSRRAELSAGHAKDTRVLEIERSTGRTSWFRYTDSGWLRGF
jgi:prepilin-type N-terminal cleavage/methylation domain-containing protein